MDATNRPTPDHDDGSEPPRDISSSGVPSPLSLRTVVSVLLIALGIVIAGMALSSLLVAEVEPPAAPPPARSEPAGMVMAVISGILWIVAGAVLWRRQLLLAGIGALLALLAGAAGAWLA